MMNLEDSYFSLMVKLRTQEGTVARGPRDPRNLAHSFPLYRIVFAGRPKTISVFI